MAVSVLDCVPGCVEVVGHRTLTYVDSLQRRHRDEVGFLSHVALAEYVNRQQVWLARENGDPCGYLLWGSFRGLRPVRNRWELKIVQACIQYDAQRRKQGERLVSKLIEVATLADLPRVGLWCADDLDANLFWESMGFRCDGRRIGGNCVIPNRPHRHWTFYTPILNYEPLRLAPPLPGTPITSTKSVRSARITTTK